MFLIKVEFFLAASDTDDVLQPIYTAVMSHIQISLRKRLDWIIDSVIDHNISISKHNTLAGSSYNALNGVKSDI